MPTSTWQEECTEALKIAVAAGRSRIEVWEKFRRDTAGNERIIIADAVFDVESLSGLDLSRCYITRTSFFNADLSDVNFTQTIFRNCTGTSANIRGANFRGADMSFDGLSLITDRFDKTTNFEVDPNKLPDDLSDGLRAEAYRSWHERQWSNQRHRSLPIKSVLWLTKYGFSPVRLSMVGVAITAAFAALYKYLGVTTEKSITSSVCYFINLDSPFDGGLLLILGSAEALMGIIFFSLLTAILVSIFFESNR